MAKNHHCDCAGLLTPPKTNLFCEGIVKEGVFGIFCTDLGLELQALELQVLELQSLDLKALCAISVAGIENCGNCS